MSSVPPPTTAVTATAASSSVPAEIRTHIPSSQKAIVEYKPHRSICCTLYKDKSNFQNILQSLELGEVQKEILKIRYLTILENFKRRSRNYSAFFFLGHTIITVGSLFVPALLSIQNSDKSILLSGDNFNIQVYWATFVISLLVTIFNGLLTLFKVDKKYYFLNTTLERLRSEGWQYFSLTGRYSGHLINHQTPTHANQFVHFTHYIEKIKMKQVEEEYFKADEKSPHAPPSGSSTNIHSTGNPEIYPLSPDKAVSDMKNTTSGIPGAVERAMNSLIKSQRTIDTTKKAENEIVLPDDAKAPPSPLPSPLSPLRRSSVLRSDSINDSIDNII
jgi:hypothetical protein